MSESPEIISHPKQVIISLEVTVQVDRDPGMDTPDTWEPPYDYLAVREVEVTNECYPRTPGRKGVDGRKEIRLLADTGGADDLDPDGLLLKTVSEALMSPWE